MTNLTILHLYENSVKFEFSKVVKKEQTKEKYTMLANDCETVLFLKKLQNSELKMFKRIYAKRREKMI